MVRNISPPHPRVTRIALICFGLVGQVFSDTDLFQKELRNADALTAAVLRSAGEAFGFNARGLEILDQGGSPDKAIVWFEKALEALPNYTDAKNNMGVAHFRKGEISAARRWWESVVAQDKEYAVAYHNLGILSFHEQKTQDAAQLFRTALKHNKRLLQSHIMLGRILLSEGKNRAAVESFERAHRINPTHPDAWSNLAYGFVESGDTVKALHLLRKHSDHPEAMGMLGTIEAKRGNTGRAAQMLASALSRGGDPSLLLTLAATQIEQGECRSAVAAYTSYFSKTSAPSPDAYLGAAIAGKECGEAARAIGFLEEGIKRFPRDPLLHYNLGKLYFGDGQYDAAEQVWQIAAQSLNDPELYYLRAMAAVKANRASRAEELVRQALARDNQARYHDLLGTLLYSAGRHKDAQESFKRALSLDPNLHSAQLNLALAGKGQQNLNAAVKLAERERSQCQGPCVEPALRLAVLLMQNKEPVRAAAVLEAIAEPLRTEAVYRTLALCYREAHQTDKAISALEVSRTRFAPNHNTDRMLAEYYLLAGYYTKAIELLRKMADQPSEDIWRVHYQLGYAFMEQNQLSAAREHFEKSLKANPGNTAGQGLLAFVLNRQGSGEQAVELWKKTLTDDPGNPVVHVNLGLAAESRGDYQTALSHYRTAVGLPGADKAVHINLGNALRALDRISEARQSYERGLESGKRDLAAYNLYLLAQKTADRRHGAEMADLLLREFPGSPYAGRVDADRRLGAADTAAALKILQSIAEKNIEDHLLIASLFAFGGKESAVRKHLDSIPDDPHISIQKKSILARCAFSRSNYTEAYRIWSTLEDTSSETRYNTGLAAMKMGNYRAALSIAEELLKRIGATDRVDVLHLAGNAAVTLRDWEGARTHFAQLSNLSPGPIVLYNLAVACYNLGDMEESWRAYNRARELDPSIINKDIENRYAAVRESPPVQQRVELDTLDNLYNRAVSLQSGGKQREAENLYRTIIRKDPVHARAHNNLGALLAARGDLREAEKHYQRAIKAQTDLPEAYANLVAIYLAQSDFQKAREWTARAKTAYPDNDLIRQVQQAVDEAKTR